MWLFFFHESAEHRKLSKDAEKLKDYIRAEYSYTTWKFNQMNDDMIQVINDETDEEEGFILKVEVI